MSDPENSRRVQIYTDGACSKNPGPGGWAALLILRDTARFISGYDPHTTNNRMELIAAIMALRALTRATYADIHTDSRYLQDGMNKWIHQWEQNNWQNSNKKPVVSQDLWRDLIEQVRIHDVKWIWVRGHSTNKMNNLVDLLARNAISHRKGVDRKMHLTELEELLDGRQIPW